MTADAARICVIGAGPRGTSVLERLCANATTAEFAGRRMVVHIVDPYPPGPGAVWRTSQSEHLLMNTVASQVSIYTDDSVHCAGPIVRGPSLYDWARTLSTGQPADVLAAAATLGPDDYPTRAFYGHYLRWAFDRLVRTAPDNVSIERHTGTAVALDDGVDGQVVTLHDGTRLTGLDAVVLAVGHGPLSRKDDQDRDHRHARGNGLFYVGPANPADVDLTPIRPGAAVALRGLGLNYFDYLTLLTVGRGGRFTRAGDGLRYLPSGREPLLYAGSRRGIPYHARGENQKGPHGRHEPVFLTASVTADLRARAAAGRPVSFRATVWPLVDREVRTAYHRTLLATIRGEHAAATFVAGIVADPGREADLLDRYGVSAGLRWRWDLIERPQGDRRFTDPADFHDWLLAYLRGDVRQARLGNLTSPMKTALDVLRDLRNEIRLVVDHGGITGESYRDDVERWYSPLNAFTSIGPPVRRVEEMIALVDAGVLHVVGPAMTVRADGDRFVVASAAVPRSAVRVTGLIEARLADVDLRRSANTLLRYLLATGQARPHRVAGDYECGGLDVTQRPYRVVDAAGVAHPGRFAFGVPTEGVHWVTAAGIRPGVGSVTLEDSDAIARAALTTIAVPPSTRPVETV